MARILHKLGLEPVVAREVETGILTMVVAAFCLLAIHTLGLSLAIHYNRLAYATQIAPGGEASKGKEEIAPLDIGKKKIPECGAKEEDKKKGKQCP